MAREAQKQKLLLIMTLFFEETDESHGITMTDILGALAEHSIVAERKSVYRDIAALREAGWDIITLPTRPVSYALGSRPLSESELMLTVDAVESSKFLSAPVAKRLTRNLSRLASRHQRASLTRHVHVPDRIRTQHESVLRCVDTIHQALAAKRKIAFRYVKPDVSKNPVESKGGKVYEETPVGVVYSDGRYYLIAYNDAHEGFPVYRIDRMRSVRVADDAATRNEAIANFNMAEFARTTFSMFGGEVTPAVLAVEEEAMGGVLDRFGNDVTASVREDGKARVTVNVACSPTFFGWVAQFGTAVTIEQPKSLREAYREFLENILDAYGDQDRKDARQ